MSGHVWGCYQLLILLPHSQEIQIGRLGSFSFPAGYYVYTGSAMGGLDSRIARHLREEKTLRWHVDYFLQYGKVVKVRRVESENLIECTMNREILARPGTKVIAPKFGSSDCKCPSHLVYLGERYETFAE